MMRLAFFALFALQACTSVAQPIAAPVAAPIAAAPVAAPPIAATMPGLTGTMSDPRMKKSASARTPAELITAPPPPQQATLTVSFAGGDVGLDLAAALNALSARPGLLPNETVTLAAGDSACSLLVKRNFPPGCSALMPTIERLNPKKNVRTLKIGDTIILPGGTITVRRAVRTFTDRPGDNARKQIIIRNWSTKATVERQVAGLSRVEYDAYDLLLAFPSDNLVRDAARALEPLRSKNVIINATLIEPPAAFAYSDFTLDYQSLCQTPGTPPKLHDYAELLESNDGLTTLLSQTTPPRTVVPVFIVDTPLARPPALIGAVVATSTTSLAPIPPWRCQWANFNVPLHHGTHMAGIIASRNGQGFSGLAPSASITAFEWYRPDATLTKLIATPEREIRLRELIGATEENPAAAKAIYLIATSFQRLLPPALDAAGQLVDLTSREAFAPADAIATERPLTIVAAGQSQPGKPPIRLTPASPLSPQNSGDWPNVVVVTACMVCTHQGASLLPEAFYSDSEPRVVHIAAPGGVPVPGWIDDTTIGAARGTSQAAAFAAGVAAEMESRYPQSYQTAKSVKLRLQATAWPLVPGMGHVDNAPNKLAVGIIDYQRAQLDPKTDWTEIAGEWKSTRIKAWPASVLSVVDASGNEQLVRAAQIMRLVQVSSPGAPAQYAVLTRGGSSGGAAPGGQVNRLGPVQLRANAGQIEYCDGSKRNLVDITDLIVTTVQRAPDAPVCP